MQLTQSAKGTIAFSAVLALAAVYCTTSSICMTEARSALIPSFGRVFGPQANGAVVVPLTVVLTGAILLGVWNSRRSAFLLALVVGVVSLAIYGFAGAGYLVAGSYAALLICTAVVVSAGLATTYAFKGWREAIPGPLAST